MRVVIPQISVNGEEPFMGPTYESEEAAYAQFDTIIDTVFATNEKAEKVCIVGFLKGEVN